MSGSGEWIRPVLLELLPMWLPGPPTDPTYFGVHVLILIGTEGGPGDQFFCTACSPSWFAATFSDEGARLVPIGERAEEGARFGNGLVFMERWSEDELRRAVQKLCDDCAGPHWGIVASRLGRVLPWEYDYRYDDFLNEHPGQVFPPSRTRHA